MKKLNLKSKWICMILIISVIFQNCSVYKRESITFDEAIATKTKVKAITKDGNKAIIKKIEKIDGVYYGNVSTVYEKHPRKIINEEDYVKIHPKDKEVSAVLTAGLIILPFGILYVAALITVNNMNINPQF